MAGTKKADAAHQFINLVLSKEIQSRARRGRSRRGRSTWARRCPRSSRASRASSLTPAEWKERGYIMNDEARAKTLPAWREWFTANIVKK